jgi:hypothetical protein
MITHHPDSYENDKFNECLQRVTSWICLYYPWFIVVNIPTKRMPRGLQITASILLLITFHLHHCLHIEKEQNTSLEASCTLI